MTRIVVVSRYVCIRSKFSELCFSFFFWFNWKTRAIKMRLNWWIAKRLSQGWKSLFFRRTNLSLLMVLLIRDISIENVDALRKYFEKPETDLAFSRSVNTKLRDRISSLEHQCWSNSQYSRRECLETTGIPDNIKNDDLEEKALMIFENLEVTIDSSNAEDCHWLPSNGKRFIIKLSKRKDANKIWRVKKGWRRWTYLF